MKIHLHNKQFFKKPEFKEVAVITNEIIKNTVDLEAKEIAEEITKGKSILLGIMEGSNSNLNLKEQELVFLDFDNTEYLLDEFGEKVKNSKGKYIQVKSSNYITIDKIKENEFIKNNALFIYKTFSYKEDHHKFRIVFKMNKKLTNYKEVKAVYESLLKMFPEADEACKNSSRIFFGGTEYIEINFNNVLKVDEMIKNVEVKKIAKKQNSPKIKKRVELDINIPELFKNGEFDEIKQYFNDKYAIQLNSKVQVINYLKSLDMREVLNIHSNPFYNIFTEENKPSSSIFKLEDSEIYLYKNFSDNFIGDVIKVVSKLLNTKYTETVNILMNLMNIKIVESVKIKEIKENIDFYINVFLSEDFKIVNPEVNSIFWRYKQEVISILNIMKENVFEDEFGNLRSLTWLSTRNISKRLYGNENKFKRVSEILNLMVYTNWIEKLEDEKIPLQLINQITKNKKVNKFTKRSNVYELNSLDDDFIEILSEKCEELKTVGFTMKGFSNVFLKGIDESEAKKVFIQNTEEKSNENIINFMIKVIEKEISEKGYIPENNIIFELQNEFGKKSFSEYKMKQLRPYLIKKGYERVRMNNKLKEKFGISKANKAMPIIFTK